MDKARFYSVVVLKANGRWRVEIPHAGPYYSEAQAKESIETRLRNSLGTVPKYKMREFSRRVV